MSFIGVACSNVSYYYFVCTACFIVVNAFVICLGLVYSMFLNIMVLFCFCLANVCFPTVCVFCFVIFAYLVKTI